MVEKLNLYDLLSGLIPGVLFIGATAIFFPHLASLGSVLPSEFNFIVLLSASMVVGILMQTTGSIIEPGLHRVLGGRPSDLALAGRLSARYFPPDAAMRIKTILQSRFGQTSSERSLFLSAMSIAESSDESKARNFNAQYGYLRSITMLLFSLILLSLASRFWGRAELWKPIVFWPGFGGLVLVTGLFGWRTWQRGIYYAREVLFSAERVLGENDGIPSKKDMGKTG